MNYFAWYQKRKKKKEKKTATLLPQRVGITTYLNAMNYFAWCENNKNKNKKTTTLLPQPFLGWILNFFFLLLVLKYVQDI